MKIKLLKIEELKPHERISPKRFERLLKKVDSDGKFTQPIVVDTETNVIVDGHHRHQVARALGLKQIPCVCINYNDDDAVRLFSRRKDKHVTKTDVITAGVTGQLLPYKTTRHEYTNAINSCDPVAIPTVNLGRRKQTFNPEFLRYESLDTQSVAMHFKKPKDFNFTPGEYTFLIPGPSSNLPGRYLSIASAPYELELRFLVRKSNTQFKQALLGLKAGDLIQIEEPGNNFGDPMEVNSPLVFVAGGVGIAPFISMLLHETSHPQDRSITVFYANRRPQTAPYLELLYEIETKMPHITIVPTMTRVSPHSRRWSGETGYISDIMIQKYVPDVKNAEYYLAGAQPMLAKVKGELQKLKVPESHIKVEHFCGYHDYICTHCLQRYTRSLIT